MSGKLVKDMRKKKSWKIKVSPAAFAGIPPRDRIKVMKYFIDAVQDGSIFQKSKPVNLARLKKKEPEVYQQLA